MIDPRGEADRPEISPRGNLSFQARLTIALLAAALLPVAALGLLLIIGSAVDPDIGVRLMLFVAALTVVVGIIAGSVVGLELVAPFKEISAAVTRVSDGDLSQPIPVEGDDVLAQLAESHNRLAADTERRNRQLGRILAAVEGLSPRDGVAAITSKAGQDAVAAFGFISAEVVIGEPDDIPDTERIPGEAVPVSAELRLADERVGIILARLPATGIWGRADQTLLDLFASQVAVALRNAQLFAQVETQNAQLRTLSDVKDDFLRGVSHNLQAPLARIKTNAESIAAVQAVEGGHARVDARLRIISDQADRLSRMVHQLLLVSRLESQPLRTKVDVLNIAPRIQRTWEELVAHDRPLELVDGAPDWLAVADADELDQVLWALLDNAVRYGEGPVRVALGANPEDRMMWITIASGGHGLNEADREWLFGRFARGAAGRESGDGSGLGLYVSRALIRAMDGDLVLDPFVEGEGATFRILLPGEPTGEH